MTDIAVTDLRAGRVGYAEAGAPGHDPATLALEQAERAGLSLALTVRSVLLGAFMLYSVLSQTWPQGLVGASFVGVFLAVGLAWRQAVRRGRDAPWMRYALYALDAGALAVAAVNMPMSTGGDVPQILVFRVFGPDVLYILIGTAALSMSPKLVLWAGACAVAALWGAYGVIVSGMERTVSWGDLPPSSSAEVFLSLFLDPDFIAMGSRNIETAMLIAVSAVLAAGVARARRLLTNQLAAERARSEVTEVFGRFVPEEVSLRLAAEGGQLPPERRVATVLFLDIEGFTAFSETASPEQVITSLDAFFDRVGRVVAQHRGVVISLIGDAALVAFNAPLDNGRHAEDAVASGRALLADWDGRSSEYGFSIRVGIATGEVAAGTVGGQGRRAYTLYGDTVNLAQRLEALNKSTGTRLMLSEATWEAAGRPAGFEHREGVTVKGREGAVDAFAWHGADRPEPA